MLGVISLVIIGGSAFSVLIGLAFLISTLRFLWLAERTTGLVVGHESQRSKDADGMAIDYVHPVVEFADSAGKTHRIALTIGTAGFQPFAAGSKVEILFPPSDPSKAKIRHFIHLWWFPIAFTLLGVVGVMFGLVFRAIVE